MGSRRRESLEARRARTKRQPEFFSRFEEKGDEDKRRQVLLLSAPSSAGRDLSLFVEGSPTETTSFKFYTVFNIK